MWLRDKGRLGAHAHTIQGRQASGFLFGGGGGRMPVEIRRVNLLSGHQILDNLSRIILDKRCQG